MVTIDSDEFLGRVEHESVVAAIAFAEKKTSGEIRVYISHRQIRDPLDAALRRFEALEMYRTRHRNAVLIYVAPRTQCFAIVGDAGVHEKCGDEFWQKTVELLGRDLRLETPTKSLVNVVRYVGSMLAQHFPHQVDDKNELPDRIALA
jgi:uncharacterized membrane protein